MARFLQFGIVIIVFLAATAAAEQPDALAARAVKSMQAGDFRAAADVLRAYLKPSSSEAALWNLLGVCESELHNPAAARQAFGRALDLDPRDVSAHENAGLFFFRQGDFAAAKRHLGTAISLGSNNPGAAFNFAAAQIRTGEKEAGMAGLKRLEPALSGAAEYWNELGWAELKENPPAASKSFERALALAPEDARALNGAASAAEAQGRDEEALSYLIRARKAHPDEIRTLLHFGSLCLRRDLSVDAEAAIGHAYNLAPSNNLALFLYARVQIASQQWLKSHELFTEFDKRIPDYAPAQYALGWLDLKMNKPEEARAHLERSLKASPGYLEPLYELGQLDLSEGRLESAEALLRKALEKDPKHAKVNLALGDLLVRQGKPGEAKSFYEASIEADPMSGPAHYKLSTVLLRLGDRERAEKERAMGAALNAEAVKASKTVLALAEPDGTLLSGGKAQ